MFCNPGESALMKSVKLKYAKKGLFTLDIFKEDESDTAIEGIQLKAISANKVAECMFNFDKI